MDATLTLDRIVGQRVWAVIPHPVDRMPVLASATFDGIWESAEMIASCRTADHAGRRIPVFDCTCGVYAGMERVSPEYRRVWAQGPVELWGRVIEGVTGYRAEHARIGGDLEVMIGMGPGFPRCTTPGCREIGEGIWVGGASFLARCRPHAPEGLVQFGDFAALIDRSFRGRYGVRASLRGRVATQ